MTNQDVYIKRYTDAMHAVQTAVAFELGRGDTSASPKHLRVGVNSALIQSSVLAELMISKGVITWEEYWKALAEKAEEEVAKYKKEIRDTYGIDVELY